MGPPPGPPLTGWPRQDPQNWPSGRAPGVIGRGVSRGVWSGTPVGTPVGTQPPGRLPSEMGAWREPIGWSGKGGSLRRDPLRLFSAMGGTWRPGRAPPSKRWAEAQRREPRMREGGSRLREPNADSPPGVSDQGDRNQLEPPAGSGTGWAKAPEGPHPSVGGPQLGTGGRQADSGPLGRRPMSPPTQPSPGPPSLPKKTPKRPPRRPRQAVPGADGGGPGGARIYYELGH